MYPCAGADGVCKVPRCFILILWKNPRKYDVTLHPFVTGLARDPRTGWTPAQTETHKMFHEIPHPHDWGGPSGRAREREREILLWRWWKMTPVTHQGTTTKKLLSLPRGRQLTDRQSAQLWERLGFTRQFVKEPTPRTCSCCRPQKL